VKAWQRTTLAVALAGAAVVGGAWLLAPGAETPAPEGPRYKSVIARRGPLRIAVAATGRVRPIDRIELKSKASGEVIELPIEVGGRVERGGLVAKLDPVDARTGLAQARADLAVAEAELEVARRSFERRNELFSRKVISREARDQTELELAVARGKLVQARSALERAEERLEETVVRSPVGGIVLQKYVERGQIIASGVSNVGGGTPIADVADMSAVHVEAGVDEIDIGRIRVGQSATVRAEAYPDQTYRGEVVRMAPEARIEQNVTLFDVVVRVENRDGNLRSGMNADVEIVIVEEPDVLTVPLVALQNGDPPSVLVRNGDGWAPREVEIGRMDHRVVEIVSGLEPGEELGIPLWSRLKEDHDRLDARMRRSRSFRPGGDSSSDKKPASGRGGGSGHP
jgi:HlyD family secretion protein